MCAGCDHEKILSWGPVGDARGGRLARHWRSRLCGSALGAAQQRNRNRSCSYGQHAQDEVHCRDRSRGCDACWTARLHRAAVRSASPGSHSSPPPVRGASCRSGPHVAIGHKGVGRPGQAPSAGNSELSASLPSKKMGSPRAIRRGGWTTCAPRASSTGRRCGAEVSRAERHESTRRQH